MNRSKPAENNKIEVLVVEDSPTQAEELKQLLEEHDYKVLLAPHGQEALALAHRHKPTLVISDIVMPEMDGYAFCRALKSDKKLKDIPVILVTLLSDPQDIIRGLECGADNFIRKPYDEKYLLARIRYLLINRELRRVQKMEMGVEIHLAGRKHFITSERQQIVDLLISVYEEAIHINEELQERQKDLARSNRSLNGLYRIAEGLNRCTSEQEVVEKALERAIELPGVRAGWVFLHEENADFRMAATRGLPPALQTPGALDGKCLCRREFLSGGLHGATNILECERLQKAPGDTGGLRYHASVPLWVGNRMLGVMNLTGSEEGLFKDEDLKILYGVGNQVAVALERARLHEHLEKKVEERTAALTAEIIERKRAEEMVKHLAYYDVLTGLPNRTLLHDRLRQAILTASYEKKAVALLLIDLDHFKEINDTLGHHRGDLLLRQIGPRLQVALRESDTIARLGGDEFAVVLPLAEAEHATLVANKILKALEEPFVIEGIPIAMEASIGIALSPDNGANSDSLIQRADVAMYTAKESRRGYTLYAAELDRHSPRRLALLGELRRAIDTNQLFLHYQPKINLQTGRITGVEALVRWKHPEHGIIPPDQFITVAEHSGLIKPLTLWVLNTALRQCQIWHQEGSKISIAVNLSARNLQDQQLPDQIGEVLQACGVAPHFLELEITESILMADPVRSMEVLTRLSKMGIQLSIDDFGTGYSSLGYLKKLPVDQIKIDKSFVIEMAAKEDDAVIVQSTIDLAHNLGLKVVAEGVETKEVWEKLAALGCDAAQGYYMGRPIAAPELTRWMSDSSWGLKRDSGEGQPAS